MEGDRIFVDFTKTYMSVRDLFLILHRVYWRLDYRLPIPSTLPRLNPIESHILLRIWQSTSILRPVLLTRYVNLLSVFPPIPTS
jgi:hypothetical protein